MVLRAEAERADERIASRARREEEGLLIWNPRGRYGDISERMALKGMYGDDEQSLYVRRRAPRSTGDLERNE